MNRISRFEKVSLGQFEEDFASCSRLCREDAGKAYSLVSMPIRATSGSAGYDLISPVSFTLKPGEGIRIPTGLRVFMEEGWVMLILPKSGLGTRFRFQLDNTAGVIDSDYYYSLNQGHVLVSMFNDSRQDKTLEIEAGKAFAQAIFLPFGICFDDAAEGVRRGGFGSTGA